MGKAERHQPVKLITGFIFKEEPILKQAKIILKNKFGVIDYESPVLEFTHTDYYEKEFGAYLKRAFVSFKKLIPPESISRIKIITNRIEEKLSHQGRRMVNIDPGYLDLSKLVLATTKDYSHRIYLSEGIYAEVTLYYRDKGFKPFAWTYPDYKTAEYATIFNQIRQIYYEQIR